MTPRQHAESVFAQNPTFGRDKLSKAAGCTTSMAQRVIKANRMVFQMPREGEPGWVPKMGAKAVDKSTNIVQSSTAPEAVAGYHTIVSLHDWHVPYHDAKAVDCQLQFCRHIQPNEIILHELHDFYALSKFNKNPSRAHQLQDEIDETFKLMKRLRGYCPDATIRLLKSNHTDRLQRYLWSNATALHGIRALELPNLFRLQELNISYAPNYQYKGALFKHGHIVRQQSAYTANAEYTREGTSGMSGHCFDEETEILTKRGWVKGFDLVAADEVGTMNKKSWQFEWNGINEFHQYADYRQLHKIKTTTVDLMVTDKHGLIFETKRGKQKEAEAQEIINTGREMLFYNSAKSNPNEQNIDLDENVVRLIINIVTDGHYEGNAIRWHMKKERKISHLIGLLDTLGMTYSVSSKGDKGTTKIRVSCESSKKYTNIIGQVKQLPAWFANLTSELVSVALDEYSITDGCKNSSAANSYQICSNKESEIDILQEMFARNGYRSSKILNQSTFVLTVNTRSMCRVGKKNITVENYSGKVWCVSVDNGTVLVRRNGKVTVTLNTHRGGAFYRTVRGGSYVWIEGGCGCDLSPEYIEDDVANWQHGMGVATFENEGKQYHLQFVPIIHGKVLWGSKLITHQLGIPFFKE